MLGVVGDDLLEGAAEGICAVSALRFFCQYILATPSNTGSDAYKAASKEVSTHWSFQPEKTYAYQWSMPRAGNRR